MRYQFERCRERGKIIQIGIDSALVEKGLIFMMKASHRTCLNQLKNILMR